MNNNPRDWRDSVIIGSLTTGAIIIASVLVVRSQPQSPSTTPTPVVRSQPQSPSTAPTPVVASQAVKAKYVRLQKLLEASDFEGANQETNAIMREIANRGREGSLTEEDMFNFPSIELQTIDRLWLQYSGGKFGFSVQKRILKNVGGDKGNGWFKFGDRVGWYFPIKNKWGTYQEVNFSLSAPDGHLPLAIRWTGDGGVLRNGRSDRLLVNPGL